METLADITISRYDSDQGRFALTQQRRTMQCYRVVGGSAQAAGRLCRERAQACNGTPLIAVTLERLSAVNSRHVEVCREVMRTAQTLGREIYLCGVTGENQDRLNSLGLLAGLGPQRVFANLNALLGNFADMPRHNHSGKPLRSLDRSLHAGSTVR